jgi:hypothetical protein
MTIRALRSAASRSLAVWVLCAAAQAHAAPQEPSGAARDLSAYKEESIPGGDLLLAAYLLGWALLGGVAVRAARQQRRTAQQLAELEARLEVAAAADGGSTAAAAELP